MCVREERRCSLHCSASVHCISKTEKRTHGVLRSEYRYLHRRASEFTSADRGELMANLAGDVRAREASSGLDTSQATQMPSVPPPQSHCCSLDTSHRGEKSERHVVTISSCM